jgi:DNA-binding Xre family transcriptional regulator
MLDREMNKKKLMSITGSSTSTMAKVTKCENVTLDVLVKICHALDCNIGDIMDVIPKDALKSDNDNPE